MTLTKFGVNFLAEMPWVPFHPREIAVYGKQRGISFLEYNQNLYYTSVRDNNQYLNLNFEENFYQSLSKLHDGINFKRVNIRDYDRGDDVVRRYFNSIFYFDEYLYEYFYGTEEYTLASKDPRLLGHLNLMANDYIPEFAGMGVTKRTLFMQVVFESTYRHHYPILQIWIHTAYILTETGNPNVNIYARNYPLPWSPEERETLSSFPDIAFNGFLYRYSPQCSGAAARHDELAHEWRYPRRPILRRQQAQADGGVLADRMAQSHLAGRALDGHGPRGQALHVDFHQEVQS